VLEKELVNIKIGSITLEGELRIPQEARGIVVFAHGSGSSRHSPRNQFVARFLNKEGLATLLLDLLTKEEGEVDERTRQLRFDIELLGERLGGVIDWLEAEPATKGLKIGFFGASTGAGAALLAAANRKKSLSAVVSRGGRPDLAGPALMQVSAPTLLIIGGADDAVIDLNRQALALLKGKKQLVIIPGATHLFEEAGALEEVARLAAAWFSSHLK
jgi:putative phosphoribosyl transferase